MGAAPSSFSLLEGKRKLAVEKLQEQILGYLSSDDYCADPYEYIKEITLYGYKTLEEFISEIPSSEVTDQIWYRHVITPAAQLGMRYVVTNEPEKRGVLAEQVVMLQAGNFATLRMDSANFHQSIFTKTVNLLLYFFFPLRFIFQKAFDQSMLTGQSQLCTFHFEQLLLEKEHLLAYLQHSESRATDNIAKFPIAEMIDDDEDHSDLLTSDNSSSEDDDDSVVEIKPHIPLQNTQSLAQEKVGQDREEEERPAPPIVAVEDENEENLSTSFMIPKIEITYPANGAVGKQKGIEGANNSCYMDSILFSMFYTTSRFDFLLKPKQTDTEFMELTRKILKEKVVTPLREIYYCDHESVMDLRIHLSVKNEELMGTFMDAEQVLYLLCEEVLCEPHFIQYAGVDDDGWGDYMHLMSIDVSDPSTVINVQRNLENSFAYNGNIKMSSVPNPAFILGMPRSNRELIHYEAVVPNPEISMANLLEIAKCHNCAGTADWEIQSYAGESNASAVPICTKCIASSKNDISGRIVSRTTMRLHSVVCIRGVHFTTFVRSSECLDNNGTRENGEVENNTWYFFDSMAGGYPEVTIVPELERWLEEVSNDPEIFSKSKDIQPLVSRCLTDGHLCIYQPIVYESNIGVRD